MFIDSRLQKILYKFPVNIAKFPVRWDTGLKKKEKRFNCLMTEQEMAKY